MDEDILDAFVEAGEEQSSPGDLQKVKALCAEVKQCEASIAALDEQKALFESRVTEIKQKELPRVMRDAGMLRFEMDDGTRVLRALSVHGSLPKEEPARTEALKYLTEIGGEGLARTVIQISFGKGEAEEARALYEKLRRESNSLNMEISYDVNHMSLGAHVRKMMEANQKVEPEKLGLWSGFVAKFTKPRKSKKQEEPT
jgi:hypothetical protein